MHFCKTQALTLPFLKGLTFGKDVAHDSAKKSGQPNQVVAPKPDLPRGPNDDSTVSDLRGILETQRAIATSDLDLDTVMQLICERAQQMTSATGAAVEMVERDLMVYKAASASIRSQLGFSLPVENSLSGICVKSGQVLVCQDTENDPRTNHEACRLAGVSSMIVVPLSHQGKTVGVLKVFSDQKNYFRQTTIDVLQLLAGIMAAALSNSLIIEANRRLIHELQVALSTVKQLDGMLPICCKCKKIREDSGYWKRLEIYISEHSEARFSHGYCPQCAEEFLKEAGLRK